MHRRFLVLSVLSAMSFAFGAVAQPKPAPAPSSTKTFTIGFSQCNSGEPWRAQMDADIKAAAKEHANIKLVAKDAQNDVTRQISQVKEFITAKVDAIVISPKENSLTSVVAEAFDAGIPVIVLDRKVQGDKYTVFIGADNRLIGAQVGEWVKKTLGGKGNVIELKGLSSSTPAQERSEPFRAAIKDTQIKIVYDADMEWVKSKAIEKMQAALARNPNKGSIQLVYGANDPAAIAAYEVAKNAGREKEMKFVGVDALPNEGVEAVRNGMLDATFQYPNGAKEAIAAALDIFAGKKPEKTITLGTRLFTKENVDKGGEKVGP